MARNDFDKDKSANPEVPTPVEIDSGLRANNVVHTSHSEAQPDSTGNVPRAEVEWIAPKSLGIFKRVFGRR